MTELANIITLLQARAGRIRKLMGDMVGNTFALGEELEKAYETFPIGPRNQRMGWKKWVKDELGITTDWAFRYIIVYQKFGHLPTALGSSNVPSLKVLSYLAKPSVPEAARREILDRAAKGEKITHKKAKKTVAERLPSPKQANEQARQTGKPVEASDGYVYFGATEAQGKAGEQRRTIVFSVREAIACLAAIELQATEFIEYAMPHQLWRPREEQQIKDALTWLKELDRAWDRRKS